jgi:Tfp pilus assembly protein PilN
MKQINLVPPAVRQKAENKQTIPLLVIAGLVGVGAAGAAWLAFNLQFKSLQATKTEMVQQEVDRQKAISKDSADFQVDADLTSRVTTLNTLAKGDVDWNKAFGYVAALLPKDITLNSYSIATSSTAITLRITGQAPSNQSYATFAKFLEQSVGTTVVSSKVDGYAYEPLTGKVTFSVTVSIPPDSVKFPKS